MNLKSDSRPHRQNSHAFEHFESPKTTEQKIEGAISFTRSIDFQGFQGGTVKRAKTATPRRTSAIPALLPVSVSNKPSLLDIVASTHKAVWFGP
jgi:hypothetical protein